MNIDHFKSKLLEIKAATEAEIKQAEEAAKPVELDQTTVGRLSRMDAMQQQEMVKAQQRRRHNLLQKIDGAFKRIENDDFGHCTNCDEEIAAKRLDLDPTTLTCIRCAKRMN